MSQSPPVRSDEGGPRDVASSGRAEPGTVQPTSISRWIVRIIRLAGWGAAGLALLGFAGAIARAADLASHFRVAYALAMLPVLATYVRGLRRRPWRPAVLTLILALDVAPIGVLYLPRDGIPEAGVGGPALSLLQFNTWVKNRDDPAVLALVEARRPDVASLQETTESLRAAVADRLADRYHILSAGSELLLVRHDGPTIRLTDWTRQVIPAGEAIAARLEVAGRAVSVLSFHAMAPIGLAQAASRDAQFAWAARWCRSRSGPVIVLGDLNATPWSYPLGRLVRDGGLVDSTRGFGVQPTWRVFYGPLGGRLAWPVQIPIDHCLHSPGLAAVARETGPACGSNHFPLFITLQWAGAAGPRSITRRSTGFGEWLDRAGSSRNPMRRRGFAGRRIPSPARRAAVAQVQSRRERGSSGSVWSLVSSGGSLAPPEGDGEAGQ